MRSCGATENDWSGSGNSAEKFMVCAGGYPVSKLPTFAAAAAHARMVLIYRSDEDISIYEVATGIHFDIPHKVGLRWVDE